jgi:hypothetical protein
MECLFSHPCPFSPNTQFSSTWVSLHLPLLTNSCTYYRKKSKLFVWVFKAPYTCTLWIWVVLTFMLCMSSTWEWVGLVWLPAIWQKMAMAMG